MLVGRQRAAFGGFDGVDDGILIDLGSHRERVDAGLAQQRAPGGGGGCQQDAHRSTVAGREILDA